MKARLCLITSLLLLSVPVLAQETPQPSGTEPSTQMAPSPDTGKAAEPMDKSGAEPAMQAPSHEAATPPPADERAATEGEPREQQAAGAPALIVFTDLTEAQDGSKMVNAWNLPVDSVEEMDIYDANGNKLGEVDAVLQDKDGEIKAVAIGYGGFLGFGEKGAIMTLDQLRLKDGTLITDVSEDQLSTLPEWMKK
jgi:sporulation protein YlmC with PRC-barrel domain